MPKKKAYTQPKVNAERGRATAVYRGADVQLFSRDLSNYASLRRGLSARMREQTLGVKTLKKASADAQSTYINVLNQWRSQSQTFKKERSHEENPVEKLFRNVLGKDYYTDAEKVEIAAANIKLKTMGAKQARKELMAGLRARDAVRDQDFYKADWFLQNDSFDPLKASDDMLRQLVDSGYVEKEYPGEADAILGEYLMRLGGGLGAERERSSNAAVYRQGVLEVAKMILYGNPAE